MECKRTMIYNFKRFLGYLGFFFVFLLLYIMNNLSEQERLG